MDTESDLRARRQGKILLFLIVGAVSGERAVGLAALTGSAFFWWPLFKLGRYHGRRRRQAARPPEV